MTVPVSSYDRATLALRPVLFLSIRPGDAKTELNLAECVRDARYSPAGSARAATALPDGESTGVFDGAQSLRVRSSAALSINHTGALTIEAWIKAATLRFSRVEGTGYVEWLGKGAPGAYEYALRIYSRGNSEGRANRISGYAFNLDGGQGSGAYFQDPLRVGKWIMVTVEFATAASSAYPTGWVGIYADSSQRDRVGLDQFDVVPRPGHAAFSIGTLTGESYFEGAIAKVAVFDRVLGTADVAAQYRAMVG